MERQILVLLMLLLTLLVLPAGFGHALDCNIDRARAPVVVTGTVVRVQPLVGEEENVSVKVDRIFRGQVGSTVVIRHNSNMGPDIQLERSKRYLLYLEPLGDGRWRTSLCLGTAELTGTLPPDAGLGIGIPVDGPSPFRYAALGLVALAGGVLGWLYVRNRRKR